MVYMEIETWNSPFNKAAICQSDAVFPDDIADSLGDWDMGGDLLQTQVELSKLLQHNVKIYSA